jgi:hypothetical protein
VYLSWAANIFIGAVLLGLSIWLIHYLFVVRKRPFCERCEKEGKRRRTTLTGAHNQPLCDQHLVEQRSEEAQAKANTEPKYDCPRHREEMEKVIIRLGNSFIIVDRCSEGCQFHDGGESEKLAAHARAEGFDSGYSAGRSVGQAVGQAGGMAVGMIMPKP